MATTIHRDRETCTNGVSRCRSSIATLAGVITSTGSNRVDRRVRGLWLLPFFGAYLPEGQSIRQAAQPK